MPTENQELDLLAAIETGKAPRRMLEFAARGFVPLPPSELVRAVASVLCGTDSELVALAEETFRGLEEEAFVGAVRSAGIRPEQLDAIARRTRSTKALELVIRHRSVPDQTLAWLAYRIPPDLQDILVTNQARLLAAPMIVERLFDNPHLSSDIRRRADEFVEEFFLKKERERQAAQGQDVDVPGEEVDAAGGADLDPEAAQPTLPPPEDEAEKSLFTRLSTMRVSERVKLAFGGNREERLFLIRDSNRLVATAVLKSPKTNEADADTIANMKNVSEDVLRAIAHRREWMKKYSILLSIVKNPRSPIDITIPLVPRLAQRDQSVLSGDRNVPEGVRVTARRIVMSRQT